MYIIFYENKIQYYSKIYTNRIILYSTSYWLLYILSLPLRRLYQSLSSYWKLGSVLTFGENRRSVATLLGSSLVFGSFRFFPYPYFGCDYVSLARANETSMPLHPLRASRSVPWSPDRRSVGLRSLSKRVFIFSEPCVRLLVFFD